MRSASDSSLLRPAGGAGGSPGRGSGAHEHGLRHWWHSLAVDARGRALRDAILLSAAGILVSVAAVGSGTVAVLLEALADHPRWRLDEWLPTVAVVGSLCLAVFAWRRVADARWQYGTASLDALTGALNRRGFMDRLHAEIAAANRYVRPVSVVAFDLDGFRRLNDALGHDVGDRVLREVVDVAGVHLREADVLARWDGGEFRLLCAHTEIEGARVVAERLRSAIEERFAGADHAVTASFGVAERAIEESAQQLLARAHRRMDHAKSTGRNRCIG